MYKDYRGREHERIEDASVVWEPRIICPCCGYEPDTEDYSWAVNQDEDECISCGSFYSVETSTLFSTMCTKYRTDDEE